MFIKNIFCYIWFWFLGVAFGGKVFGLKIFPFFPRRSLKGKALNLGVPLQSVFTGTTFNSGVPYGPSFAGKNKVYTAVFSVGLKNGLFI